MSPDKPLIVVAESYLPEAIERLRAVGEVVLVEHGDEPALLAAVSRCQALLVRSYTSVTSALIERAPRLRVIGRGGVGLDNIDVEAANRRGVAVVYTPAAATTAVADLTVGLMIAVTRRIVEGDTAVRVGQFSKARRFVAERELSQCTVGIVGMGRVGRAVAQRCRHGFGSRVLFNDIVAPGLLPVAAESVSKEVLFEQSDVVSLHVPLTEQTRSLIGKNALADFKQGAVLINTARGLVVDSLALADALENGHLGGAGLDVVDPEPLPADHLLLSAPNVVLTPHVGARTSQGQALMNAVVDDVIAVLEDRSPVNLAG